MAVKPILFSSPMVRALLDGSKTQTRRLVKDTVPEPPGMFNLQHAAKHFAPYLDSYCSNKKTAANPRGMGEWWCWWTRDDRCGPQFKVKFVPGDVLWVKEPWQESLAGFGEPYDYLADRPRDPLGWQNSMFMPRTVSRLTLEVTGVQVERLQEISDADVEAEGTEFAPRPFGDWKLIDCPWPIERDAKGEPPPAIKYAYLWNTINTKPGTRWVDNPWIVAVTFTVHKINVEAYLAQQKDAA